MAKASGHQLLMRNGQRYKFADLCGLSPAIHEEIFLRGKAPRLRDVAGWEFRGMNGGSLPPILGIRRYIKGFCAVKESAEECRVIDGYNLWAKQGRNPSDPLGEPWIPVTSWLSGLTGEKASETVPRHGLYKVMPASESPTDHEYPHAVLLDYSLGQNPWDHPGRFLKDYMVQVYDDDPGLLIGKAYFGIGKARIFGSHFVMERARRPEGERSSGAPL